ncbi:MAG: IclR family transcriptional regulator [Terriglobia bacterium]
MESDREGNFPYQTQVIDRAFAILDVLAASARGQSLTQLTHRLGLSKSTCHRLLKILERYRFAEKDPLTSKFRLGGRVLELGAQAAAQIDVIQEAIPFLERLSQETRETARLGVLTDLEVVSIATADGHHALRMSPTLGRRSPVYCSSLGKAILAFLPEEKYRIIMSGCRLRPFTRNTITRRSDLRMELTRIKKRGYAIDQEELESGLSCIGAPVWDYSCKVVAAISIAGAAQRFGREQLPELAQFVMSAAADLSRRLGYQPPGAK